MAAVPMQASGPLVAEAPFGLVHPVWTSSGHPALKNNAENNSSNASLATTMMYAESDSGSELSSLPAAATVVPKVEPAPAPANINTQQPRRRGCHHCITCSGLPHHCHSATVRSSESPAAEWWPGGIHSPVVYYHLRARQLRYQQRHPQRGIQQWRLPTEVTTTSSSLLERRQHAPMAVLVPVTFTNVSQDDAQPRYVGEKVVQLSRKPARRTPSPVVQAPIRATWPSAERTEELMVVDTDDTKTTKRRCTEVNGQLVRFGSSGSIPSSSASNSGHFIIARNLSSGVNGNNMGGLCSQTPPLSGIPIPNTYNQTTTVYPGIVLQQNLETNDTAKPATGAFMGVITPPIKCLNAPLSAGSDASRASSDTMMLSSGSNSCDISSALLARDQSMLQTEGSTTYHFPVLVINGQAQGGGASIIANTVDDSTMQQYLVRQYQIKQEQAFPCQPVESAPVTHDSGGWSSVLRSIAGTLKRAVSP